MIGFLMPPFAQCPTGNLMAQFSQLSIYQAVFKIGQCTTCQICTYCMPILDDNALCKIYSITFQITVQFIKQCDVVVNFYGHFCFLRDLIFNLLTCFTPKM